VATVAIRILTQYLQMRERGHASSQPALEALCSGDSESLPETAAPGQGRFLPAKKQFLPDFSQPVKARRIGRILPVWRLQHATHQTTLEINAPMIPPDKAHQQQAMKATPSPNSSSLT
jgi:hypothetical protein